MRNGPYRTALLQELADAVIYCVNGDRRLTIIQVIMELNSKEYILNRKYSITPIIQINRDRTLETVEKRLSLNKNHKIVYRISKLLFILFNLDIQYIITCTVR